MKRTQTPKQAARAAYKHDIATRPIEIALETKALMNYSPLPMPRTDRCEIISPACDCCCWPQILVY